MKKQKNCRNNELCEKSEVCMSCGIYDLDTFSSTAKAGILDARDRLSNLGELVSVVGEALTNSELTEIKRLVRHVLYYYIEKEIKLIEEGLSEI